MNPPLSRIAIIDHAEDDAFVLAHLLEKGGLKVTPQLFTSAERAVAALTEACPPDGTGLVPTGIFVNVWLKGIGGFELLNWIRRHEALRSLVVVLLSRTDEPRDLGKAARLGADGYIIKFPPPSGMREILLEVERSAVLSWPRPVLPISCNLLGAVQAA